MHYFERQRIDEAGIEAVRLQKYILWVLLLSVMGRICAMVICIITGYWGWDFFVGIGGWFVLACGFFGASLRSKTLLVIYVVLATMWIIFRGVMLPFIIMQIVAIADCSIGGHGPCPKELHLGAAPITVVIVMSIIETVLVYLVWFFMLYGAVIAYRLRKLLKRETVTIYERECKDVTLWFTECNKIYSRKIPIINIRSHWLILQVPMLLILAQLTLYRLNTPSVGL